MRGNLKVNIMDLLLFPQGRTCSTLGMALSSSGFFQLIQKPYDSARAENTGALSKTYSCQYNKGEPWPIPCNFSANISMIFTVFGSPDEQLSQEKVMEDILGWTSGDADFSFLCDWFSCDPEAITSPFWTSACSPNQRDSGAGGLYSLFLFTSSLSLSFPLSLPFFSLDYWFIIKEYNVGKARWKRRIGEGMGKGADIPCSH